MCAAGEMVAKPVTDGLAPRVGGGLSEDEQLAIVAVVDHDDGVCTKETGDGCGGRGLRQPLADGVEFVEGNFGQPAFDGRSVDGVGEARLGAVDRRQHGDLLCGGEILQQFAWAPEPSVLPDADGGYEFAVFAIAARTLTEVITRVTARTEPTSMAGSRLTATPPEIPRLFCEPSAAF